MHQCRSSRRNGSETQCGHSRGQKCLSVRGHCSLCRDCCCGPQWQRGRDTSGWLNICNPKIIKYKTDQIKDNNTKIINSWTFIYYWIYSTIVTLSIHGIIHFIPCTLNPNINIEPIWDMRIVELKIYHWNPDFIGGATTKAKKSLNLCILQYLCYTFSQPLIHSVISTNLLPFLLHGYTCWRMPMPVFGMWLLWFKIKVVYRPGKEFSLLVQRNYLQMRCYRRGSYWSLPNSSHFLNKMIVKNHLFSIFAVPNKNVRMTAIQSLECCCPPGLHLSTVLQLLHSCRFTGSWHTFIWSICPTVSLIDYMDLAEMVSLPCSRWSQ